MTNLHAHRPTLNIEFEVGTPVSDLSLLTYLDQTVDYVWVTLKSSRDESLRTPRFHVAQVRVRLPFESSTGSSTHTVPTGPNDSVPNWVSNHVGVILGCANKATLNEELNGMLSLK